jgi:hypothetical protein
MTSVAMILTGQQAHSAQATACAVMEVLKGYPDEANLVSNPWVQGPSTWRLLSLSCGFTLRQ